MEDKLIGDERLTTKRDRSEDRSAIARQGKRGIMHGAVNR